MAKSLDTSEVDIFEESIRSTISQLIGNGLSFIHVIAVTYFLTIEQVGLYFFYLSIIYLFSQVPHGIGVALRKRVSSTEKNRPEYYASAVGIALPILVVLAGIFLVVFPLINSYTTLETTRPQLLAVVVGIFGKSFMTMSKKYMEGVGMPAKAQEIKNYVSKLLHVIFTIILLYIAPTVALAVIAYAASRILSAIMTLYFSLNSLTFPTKNKMKSISVFSKWSVPNSLLNDFYNQFDTILLGAVVSATAISYYDTSVKISGFGFAFGIGLAAAANIKLSGLYETNQNIQKPFMMLMSLSTLFVLPLLILSYIHGEFLLTYFYGPEYAEGVWFLIGIALQQIFQVHRFQFEALLNSIDRPRSITTASVVAVILNVVTAYPLILQFGGIGVVISTLFSEFIGVSIYQYITKQYFGVFALTRDMAAQVGITIIVVLLTIFRGMIITFEPTTAVIMDSIIILVVFYGGMYALSENVRALTRAAKELPRNYIGP